MYSGRKTLRSSIQIGRILAVIALIFGVGRAFAETRAPLALEPLGVETFSYSRLPSPPPPPTASFYSTYFESSDGTTVRLYGERYGYPSDHRLPEQDLWRYGRALPTGVTLPNGSTIEQSSRSDFATQVMRLRVQTALLTYLADPNRPSGVAKAGRTVQSLRSVSVGEPANSASGGIRFEYDVLADMSRLEYRSPLLSMGIYHPRLLASLSGMGPRDPGSVGITKRLGPGKTAISVNYPLTFDQFQATISQPLSPVLDASLLSTGPLGNSAVAPGCQITFFYRF